MPTEIAKIPLPQLTYDVDDELLPQEVGAAVFDMFKNDFGSYQKRPALDVFTDVGSDTPIDGIYWSRTYNILIVVSGTSIYKVRESGGITDITGDTLLSDSPVTFTEGTSSTDTYIVMANGGQMVTYNNSGTTVKMSTLDAAAGGDGVVPGEGAFGGVSHVEFIDGYLLANEVDTTNWYFSDPLDMRLWAPGTDVYLAETHPDLLLAIHVANRQIYLFGTETVEVWYNDGFAPFSRIDGGFLNVGCSAKSSIIEAYGDFLFLDDKRRVMRLTGNRFINVSAPIEKDLRELTYVADARGDFVHFDRRAFYVLTFLRANKTFVFDLSTNMWTNWSDWSSTTGDRGRFIAQEYILAEGWNRRLFGDKTTGRIYNISFDTTSDNGNSVVGLIRTGMVDHGITRQKKCIQLVFRCKRGQGKTTDTTAPTFSMRYRDKGKDWSNVRTISLGLISDREIYVRVKSLGMYRARQYEFTHAADSEFDLVEIEEEFEVMMH